MCLRAPSAHYDVRVCARRVLVVSIVKDFSDDSRYFRAHDLLQTRICYRSSHDSDCRHRTHVTGMPNLIPTVSPEVPSHIRHMLKRISARACGSRPSALAGAHHSGSATRKRRPLLAVCRPRHRSVADAAAFCAPCWPPLAAPSGMCSLYMRTKHTLLLAACLPAHTGREYTPDRQLGGSMRASKAQETSNRAAKEAPRGDARTIGLRIVPELLRRPRLSAGAAARPSRAPPPGDDDNVDRGRGQQIHVPERASPGEATSIYVHPHE